MPNNDKLVLLISCMFILSIVVMLVGLVLASSYGIIFPIGTLIFFVATVMAGSVNDN